MCIAPPGHPGLWSDSATGRRGDPLELLRLRLGDAIPDRAIAEARAFLAATGDAAPAMRRARCTIGPRPRSGCGRSAAPSTARTPRRICARAASSTAPDIAAAGDEFNDDLIDHGRDALGARIRSAARASPRR